MFWTKDSEMKSDSPPETVIYSVVGQKLESVFCQLDIGCGGFVFRPIIRKSGFMEQTMSIRHHASSAKDLKGFSIFTNVGLYGFMKLL